MHGRRGYTLMEVAAVLGIIIVVATISIPLVRTMMGDRNLQAAQDMVKERWSKMRSQALAKGQAFRFGYQENSGKFRIAPEGEFWNEGADDVEDAELPKGIAFGEAHGDLSVQNGWVMGQTCYADGSVQFNDESGKQLTDGSGNPVTKYTLQFNDDVNRGVSASISFNGITGAASTKAPGSEGNRP